MKLQLRKFDMNSIADDKVVCMIGKRGVGKSFLVRDLLHSHRDLPIGTIISPTESANKFFSAIVPPIFIHEEYTPEVIENVVKRQKIVMKLVDKEKSARGSSAIDPRAFLVLDDCLYDQSWTKDKNMRMIFMNGRHHKIMFVLTMQYPLGMPPNLRTQIDYTFICRENLISNRKRIYENYCGMFNTFDMFCQVMDQCTENYECLVIHNNARSNKLEDQVFWYKAETHPNFKLGAREFWTMSEQQAAEDDDDDGEEMYNAASLKPKGPIISVSKQGPPWLS